MVIGPYCILYSRLISIILHIRGFVASDFQYLRARIQIRGYHHRVEREKIL